MDDDNETSVLVLENQNTGELEEFQAVDGEIHVPKGNYVLRSPIPQSGMIYLESTILV